MGSVDPILRVVAAELAEKLDAPGGVSFDTQSLWAYDLAGRASAFKSMMTAGMSADEVMNTSGLMVSE